MNDLDVLPKSAQYRQMSRNAGELTAFCDALRVFKEMSKAQNVNDGVQVAVTMVYWSRMEMNDAECCYREMRTTIMEAQMKSRVNVNEAPEGYIAVESVNCTGCAFKGATGCIEVSGADCGFRRRDNKSVIFIKKPDVGLKWDPTDAPKGCQAIESLTCLGCIFRQGNRSCTAPAPAST